MQPTRTLRRSAIVTAFVATLTVGVANTYTGPTTLNGGVLIAASLSSSGASSIGGSG